MKRVLFFLRYKYTYIYRGILFLLAMSVMVFFFPKTARFNYQYTQGYPWAHHSLKAPFDFAVLKTTQVLKKEKQESLAQIIPYYRYYENMTDSLTPLLKKSFDKEWGAIYGKNEQSGRKHATKTLVENIYAHLLATGIRSQETNRTSPDGRISLLKGNQASQIPISSIYTLTTAEKYISDEVAKASGVDKKIALHVLTSHLFRNIAYDELTTSKEEKIKLANISPSFGMVQKGELIISEGELVTAQKYQVLESLRQEFEKQLGGNREFYGILLGQIILMIFVFITLMLYLNLFRPVFLRDTHMLMLLLTVIMMMVIPESIIIQHFPNYVYFFPLPILAIITRSFFDERTAMFVYLLTTIMIASFIPDGYNFMFLQLITGIITIVSIYKLDKRAQFYITSFWIFLSYSLIYMALLLVSDGSLGNINYKIFYNFAISAGLTLFSYPIIYFFEKVFKQVTHLSLLELSDTNNKLLRDLAQKAPGTFQHSLQVGNLAESALSEIGGNTLLVRAGALYHDIGKMYNPIYFIENQTTHINPHDELSYEESADTIISHVIQGVSLAKKHNLPEMIIDFIRTHHGNRKVEYFYRLAVKEAGDEKVDESTYTYPGPIPYSRETAVLMMADSIEAAARSISKPDEIKLSNLVDQIIDGQMQAGQYNNADITLREISQIKKIFTKILLTIYHIRIEYPS